MRLERPLKSRLVVEDSLGQLMPGFGAGSFNFFSATSKTTNTLSLCVDLRLSYVLCTSCHIEQASEVDQWIADEEIASQWNVHKTPS